MPTKLSPLPAGSLGFALMLLAFACAPSKPTGADYVGVWTGTSSGCECMLDVAAHGDGFMMKNENECGACGVFQGVYTLTADGSLAGGSTGAVTLMVDRKKDSATLRSGSAQLPMKKLSAQALSSWRFAQRLITRYGFKIDDDVTVPCAVDGEAGRCALASFPIAGAKGRSCEMFATARYRGDCVDGMLSGLCLISGIDHVAEGDVAMGYFVRGRVLYPTFIANTTNTSYPFGLQVDERMFYHCHERFSSNNERYGCMSFRSLLGGDSIFSRETHDTLRNGTFDLAQYRVKLEQRVTE